MLVMDSEDLAAVQGAMQGSDSGYLFRHWNVAEDPTNLPRNMPDMPTDPAFWEQLQAGNLPQYTLTATQVDYLREWLLGDGATMAGGNGRPFLTRSLDR